MNYPAISGNEAPRSLFLVIEPIFSVLGLILVLFACGSVHAQSGPMDSPPIGKSAPEQYKRGETPTGQEYGIIKKGEPHKSDAGKPDADKKRETKPGPESFIERDPSPTSEGSGPDPLGRY
jgi:hypothetical protein